MSNEWLSMHFDADAAATRANDAIRELRDSTIALARLFDEKQHNHQLVRKDLIEAERRLDLLGDAFAILEAGGSVEAFVDTAYVAMKRFRPPTVKLPIRGRR